MRLFSYRDRPVHLGPYPLERLRRTTAAHDPSALSPMQALHFEHDDPESMAHAMARYMAMFDLVRDGAVNPQMGEIPAEPDERARHFKAAGYYFDASMMGICALPASAWLADPIRNPAVPALGGGFNRSMQRIR